MDLGNKAVVVQLNNVIVEVAKASVIADHVDGQYSLRIEQNTNQIILNCQLVKFL